MLASLIPKYNVDKMEYLKTKKWSSIISSDKSTFVSASDIEVEKGLKKAGRNSRVKKIS